MRRPWRKAAARVAALVLCAVVSVLPAAAADPDPPTFEGLDLVVNSAAIPYFWSRRCGIGDPEVWKRAVAMVDRRLRVCAGRHPGWQAGLAEASSKVQRDAPVRTSDKGLAELLFWRLVEQHQGTPLDIGKTCAEFRASAVAMDVLAPGSVDDKAREAAWAVERERETAPTTYCEWGCPTMMLEFRKLGEDERWIDAPCANLVPQRAG